MRRGQEGFVALALIVLLSLATAATLLRGLNAAQDDLEQRARRDTLRALREARLALIAYGLVEDNTPGTLPCPSAGLEGKGALSCGGGGSAFGRFPWFQLGMMARFDGEGECLWYAVDRPFINTGNVSQRNPANAINPSRGGSLVLTEENTEVSLASIVLAPGRPLPSQWEARTTGAASPCAPGHPGAFLEGSNGDADERYERQPPSTLFNDQLAEIPRGSLLRPLLKRVLTALSAPSLRAEIGHRLSLSPAAPDLATLRLLDAPGFDALLFADSHTAPSGSCPFSAALARHPVSWLCFNDWYSHIQPQQEATGWVLRLVLDPHRPDGYQCRLDGLSGNVSCGGGA